MQFYILSNYYLIDFSRNASDLAAGDTLFLALLADALQLNDPESNAETDLDVIMIEKENTILKENGNHLILLLY